MINMPGAELADYGIAFFTIAVLAYVLVQIFVNMNAKRNHETSLNEIMKVIDNNTKALNELIRLIHKLETTLTRQEAKIDELLARARRGDDD